MEIYKQSLEGYESKFVITEDEAYFVPYLDRMDAPKMIEILGEIFDLDDPEVYREVDGKLFSGRIILGHYDPSNKEVVVSTPLETNEYVEKRIKEVFGNV